MTQMKSKTLNLLSLSIFSLILFMSFASSAEVTFDPTALTGEGDQGTTVDITFTISNGYVGNLSNMSFVFEDLLKDTIVLLEDKLEVTGLPDEIAGESDQEVTLTVQIPTDQEVGLYEGEIEFWAAITTDPLTTDPLLRGTLNVSITVTEPEPEPDTTPQKILNDFEGYVLDDDFYLDIDDIKVIEGYGDDEEWFIFDEIEVTIDVENDFANDDIDKLEIRWGLYDSDGSGSWYIDDEENDFTLKDGKDKTLTITFKLDEDIDELEDGDWTFYAWAIGKLDDDDKTKIHAEIESQSIDIVDEDDFVVLDDISFTSVVSCGEEVQITGDVWNIGSDDQEDVFVKIYNNQLGINEWIDIGEVDSYEDESFSVNIKIPSNVEAKTYYIDFIVFDDDEIYENEFDDDLSQEVGEITLEGSCSGADESQVVVDATLESEAKAGQELVVRATITNTGNALETYTISAVDYETWAAGYILDQDVLVISGGESQEVVFTFDVNSGVEGDKTFNIQVTSDGDIVEKQPVVATIKPAGSLSDLFGDNWYLWAIGALNIVLVVVIIIVAVRVARK